MSVGWKRAASSPDPKLIVEVMRLGVEPRAVGTPEEVQMFLDALESVGSGDDLRQEVTRRNFDQVFVVWKSTLFPGLGVQEAARAYLIDLTGASAPNDSGKIALFGEGQPITAQVSRSAYDQFWKAYKRPPSNKEMQAIQERKDRLIAIQQRRESGEFFTALDIAALGHDYLLKVVPDAYENWNWWDPACGTGNLTFVCPSMPGRLFLSTLNQEDVDTLRESGATTPAMLFEATRESRYAALYQEAAGETLSVAGDENSALADFAGAFNQLELVRIRSEYERLTAGGVPSETERRRIQELSRRLAELKGAPVPGARPQA